MDVDIHLGTEAWLSLAVGGLMIAAGLIALLAPLRHLGGQQRPWLLIWVFLPQGLLRIAITLAEAAGAENAVSVLLVTQTLLLVGIIAFVVSRWRQARRQVAVLPQPPSFPSTLGEPTMVEVEVEDFLAAGGNKIEAIRRVRERTGMGLKEAKDLVDRAGAGRHR